MAIGGVNFSQVFDWTMIAGETFIDEVTNETSFYDILEWIERPLPQYNGSFGRLAVLSADGGRLAANFVHSNPTNGSENSTVVVLEYSASKDSWRKIGNTIEIQGEALIIKLSGDGNSAAVREESGVVTVWTFWNVSSTWEQLGEAFQIDPSSLSFESIALSFDGTIVAVGKSSQDTVAVFSYTGNKSSWEQIGQSLTGGDQFGHSVALSKDGYTIAVGAASVSTRGNLVFGQVQVHRLSKSSDLWTRIGKSINGDAVGENFGYTTALSADGRILAVGSSGNGGNNGRVSLFSYKSDEEEWVEYDLSYVTILLPQVVALASTETDVTVALMSTDATDFVRFSECAPVNGTYPPFFESPSPSSVYPLEVNLPSTSLLQNESYSDPGNTTVENQQKHFQQATFLGIVIEFTNVGRLNKAETSSFEQLTAEWFQDYFSTSSERRLKDTSDQWGIEDMEATFTVSNQEIAPASPENPLLMNRITYGQSITFISSHDASSSMEVFVTLPFLDASAKTEYEMKLEGSIYSFENVETIGVPQIVDASDKPATPIESRDADQDSDGVFLKTIFIGIPLVVALTLAVTAMVHWKLSRVKNQEASSDTYRSSQEEGATTLDRDVAGRPSTMVGVEYSPRNESPLARFPVPVTNIECDRSPSLSSIPIQGSTSKPTQEAQTSQSIVTQIVEAVRLEPEGSRLMIPHYKDQVREAPHVAVANVIHAIDDDEIHAIDDDENLTDLTTAEVHL